ncbi:type VI secretion system contractile sheath small subunit [Celerinatantimonas sp. MCCC 1A17872]|uniref:type VI secretion system contractile sheath small subunit n=1 Tax=Celerinatantimonas sp. MCCC 1A17872 TaxID=3177514 RepID=UPI0038CBEBE2
MAKEGTIAPKERVNIVYKPETGGAQEEVELPLKLLVMSDFTQKADERMVEDRTPINIDKDNFDEVLGAQNLELNFNVSNHLVDEEDAQLAVNLKLKSLKDFDPDRIVEQVPELKKLMELREALKALRSPLSNVPEFRRKVQELVQDQGVRAKLLKELGIEEGE